MKKASLVLIALLGLWVSVARGHGGSGYEEAHAMAFLVFIVVGAYFAPTLVACVRGKRDVAPTFLVNFLLGWSIIGWIGALVLAFWKDRGQKQGDKHGLQGNASIPPGLDAAHKGGYLGIFRCCKGPWYYWYAGQRQIAAGAWLLNFLIVTLLLISVPVFVQGDELWWTIAMFLLGFILKGALPGFAVFLVLLYYVAPELVRLLIEWLMNLMLPQIAFLILGAVWGFVQIRLLTCLLAWMCKRKNL